MPGGFRKDWEVSKNAGVVHQRLVVVSRKTGWFQERLCGFEVPGGFRKGCVCVWFHKWLWIQERPGGILGGFRKGWVVSGRVAVSEKTGWFQVGVGLKLFGGRQPPPDVGKGDDSGKGTLGLREG